MDVQIDEFVTELIIADNPAASLSRDEMKRIVEAVTQHLEARMERDRQRQEDTDVRDRAYREEAR